ncbi:ceramide synthase 2-like [Osmerus eperlanus]|uniref:ceramide synthase 2-like n=1 Tax=Osmerus eperlanus TaxID=29151 RepID=UPI002E119A24
MRMSEVDLWPQWFWLPPGVSWEDLEHLGADQPRPRDLLLALPLALAFITLRCAYERVVAPPLARYLGVRNRPPPPPSPTLENFYTQHSSQPSQSDIITLMSQCDKTKRQVDTWFRHRRNQDRPSPVRKCGEASWRFLFYISAFLSGLAVLIDRPWFWDQTECWKGYPLQHLERAHYWYYQLELGFYLSLLLRVSVDVKRKDFREQVLHHLATSFLLGFSYVSNYVRVGTLVLVLHDASDVVLEFAKMLHYGTGWRRVCDGLFIIFAVTFILTRLLVFPLWIIHTTLVVSMQQFQPFAGYYFFNALLLLLLGLHMFWAVLILRMAHRLLLQGELDKDERSDEESEEEETDDRDEDEEGRWDRRTGALNSKLAQLTNSCVLNNIANHRASAARTIRKTK